MKLFRFAVIALLGFILNSCDSTRNVKPNLIIIHTDEHNFRTLGCYRELLSNDQAYVWGDGVEVETPNIDRLAHEGVLCDNYYAANPVCTPSRASFVTGLYPIATGAYKNDVPLNDDVVTFAEVLTNEGYSTSYVGKWHLDGEAKPGFAPARKFGFADNRYMFNRGHWKGLGIKDGQPYLLGRYNEEKQSQHVNIKELTDENFTTDFLISRALDILEREKDKPFCIMISLPDPHGPNSVRPPYDTMYKDMHFEKPRTMLSQISKLPRWSGAVGKDLVLELEQDKMQRYFGMVKCIDDNVGRILDFLDRNELAENTIVVFTSDHGDLMGEHHKHNKGNPYEASAKIPFILRYPAKINDGKIIRKAYTTNDFTPTILSMMGASALEYVHGMDASGDFLSSDKEIIDGRITYITSSNGGWIASVSNRYKLVLSPNEDPWLIDLQEDPDELINFYSDPGYSKIADKMKTELLKLAGEYKDPALNSKSKPLISKSISKLVE